MKNYTCCFFGHRNINVTEKLKNNLYQKIESLIVDEKVDIFLFGSKSRFDDLCLETVTKLKEKYSHIKRIYIRAEFPVISDSYKEYLLKHYEDTYYPEKILNAGRAVYVERNFYMVDKSRFCIVYYNESEIPSTRKSGTKTALNYAIKNKKELIFCQAE